MLTTRYLLKNLLLVTAFVAFTLTVVIWLTQSLKLLELVASSDAPPTILIKLVALTLPRFLEIILPVSLVISILFVYHKMIMDNEMIVMRACGFDQFALARPALIIAVAMVAFIMALTTYVSPKCIAAMQLLKQEVKTQYSSFLLREGVFNTFGQDLTVYVSRRADNGDLSGLMIHDTRDRKKPPVTITAKSGRIFMDGEKPRIVVYEGMRQQMDEKNSTTSKLFFSSYSIEVSGFDESSPSRWRESNERTFLELLSPDMKNPRDRANIDSFLGEAHSRIATPFNALSFALISLAAILLGPFNRRGQGKKVMIGGLLVILLQAASLSMLNMARKHLGAVPGIYAVSILPLFIAGYALTFNGEMMLMSALRKMRRRKELAA